MKKIISIFIALLFMVGAMAGCGKTNAPSGNDKIKIVTTIFPQYDWVREILGDNIERAELTMLLDNGVDLHSYQPSADDIIKISDCDMFIYVGGESDSWVDGALKVATNKDMVVINLLEVLGDLTKQEEFVEGMQEEDHEHDEDHEHEEDHEEVEYDEHVWLSLKNAQIICKDIADNLGEIDPEHKDDYNKNVTDYTQRLSSLDTDYKTAVSSAAKKTVLFGDRFPFRYLTDDYGLKYYAAFVGCSAETEASFETITFLANKVDELGISCIFTIEGRDNKIAQTIISNTKSKNQKVLSIDSMQSINTSNVKGGTTYLSVMQKNLEVLKEALG